MLDAIRKLLRSPKDAPPTAATIAAAIDFLDTKAAEARAALAAAEDRRADAVLSGDAAAADVRAEVAALAADLVDLGAARTRLVERLAATRQAEAEVERRAAYDAAHTKREAAAKAVAARYPKLRADLLALIRQIAEADAAIAAVNAALPADADPIDPVETFRDTPALAEETVKVEVTERWVARPEFGSVDVDPSAAGFVDRGDGSAIFTIRVPGTHLTRTGIADRITTTTRHVLPWQPGVAAERLATARLPGVAAGDPAFDLDARFTADPDDVLRAVERATAATQEQEQPARVPIVRTETVNLRPSGLSARAA
ncbi:MULTISPECIES: hypothetical protein [Hyphomicrobiales]|jgi:hypothetical protein|uniref:hypothetical protein n=1 Tax=Methylobacterium sp. CCH7-A2 TaxID=1768789 RepID=UPI0008329E10|nr:MULTISPECIES: hypothetical protein [Hyphomicrobiales]